MMRYEAADGNPLPDIRNAAHGIALHRCLVRMGQKAAQKAEEAKTDHRNAHAQALADMGRYYAKTAHEIAMEIRRAEQEHIHGLDCAGTPCHRIQNLEYLDNSLTTVDEFYGQALRTRQDEDQMLGMSLPSREDVRWYQLCETVILAGEELTGLLEQGQPDGPGKRNHELDTARDLLTHISDEIERLQQERRADKGTRAKGQPQDADSLRGTISRETKRAWAQVMAAIQEMP